MYTRLETGSRGGEGPFFNTMLKNLIRIKNSFPRLLTLRTTKKHVGMSLCFFFFSFGSFFLVKA